MANELKMQAIVAILENFMSEELAKQGKSEEEIQEIIQKYKSRIEKQAQSLINSTEKYTTKEIKAVKSKKEKQQKNKKSTLSKEEKQAIRARLLQGETVEEICEENRFTGYRNTIEKMNQKTKNIIQIMKLMPLNNLEISEASARQVIYREKLIPELNRKANEVMQRLKAGETPEQIVADRKLNVCIEGVQAVQQKLEEEQAKLDQIKAKEEARRQKLEERAKKKEEGEKLLIEKERIRIERRRKAFEEEERKSEKKQQLEETRRKAQENKPLTREEAKALKARFLAGETVETICLSEQFLNRRVPVEMLYEKLKIAIQLVQLMPYELIGVDKKQINYSITYNKLSSIIKNKKEDVKQRLNNGETPEQIVADKNLNVCIEGVLALQQKLEEEQAKLNKIKTKEEARNQKLEERAKRQQQSAEKRGKAQGNKRLTREQIRTLKARILSGDTLDEICAAEEFANKRTQIEKLYEKYDFIIQLVRLMPHELMGADYGRIHRAIHNNALSQTINTKKKEVQNRLQAGQSPEEIAADKKLNVCIEGVKQIQAKLEKKTAKPKAATTERRTKQKGTTTQIKNNPVQPIVTKQNTLIAHKGQTKLNIMRRRLKDLNMSSSTQNNNEEKKEVDKLLDQLSSEMQLIIQKGKTTPKEDAKSGKAILEKMQYIVDNSDSLEVLRKLNKIMIQPEIKQLANSQANKFVFMTLNRQISYKIENLNRKQYLNTIEYPKDLIDLGKQLFDGNINIEDAKKIVQGREAQFRAYISGKKVGEQGTDLNRIFADLVGITGSKEAAISVISTICMTNKLHKQAVDFTQTYLQTEKRNTEEWLAARRLQKQAQQAMKYTELASTIRGVLSRPQISIEDDEQLLSIINKRLEAHNIDKSRIIMGTTLDGKDITLQDIWYSKDKQDR